MTSLLYKLFPHLTMRQKLMLRLLTISMTMILFGAFFKINDRPNSNLILGLAMIFQTLSIIGLLSKWASFRTKSEE